MAGEAPKRHQPERTPDGVTDYVDAVQQESQSDALRHRSCRPAVSGHQNRDLEGTERGNAELAWRC